MLVLLFAILELLFLFIVFIFHMVRRSSEEEAQRKAKSNAIASFKGKSADFLATAKKMVSVDEPKMALAAVRNSLEALIKLMADEIGMQFTPETTLFEMINALDDLGVLHASQVSLMHRIRIACNRGSHVELNEIDISKSEAKKAIDLMEQLIQDVGRSQGRTMPDVFVRADS